MIRNYRSPQRRFMDWYDRRNPLPPKQTESMSVADMLTNLDEEQILESSKYAFTVLRDALPKDKKNAALGVIYVGYGFCTAAVQTKRGISVVTNQNGFCETCIWPYNVVEQLGLEAVDADEENEEGSALDAFLQWTMEPWAKADLFYDVYRKILRKIILETIDRLGDGSGKALLVSVPPISPLVRADWEKIISALIPSDCAVFLTDHSVWFDKKPQERLFSFFRHVYDGDDLWIVEVYDQVSSKSTAFAYLPNEELNESTELSQPSLRWIAASDTPKSAASMTARNASSDITWPESKLTGVGGFTAFLQKHAATFRDAVFLPKDVDFPQSGMIAEILHCFQDGIAMPAIHIGAKLCNVNNADQIALSDMVTVCSLLENYTYFQRTDVVTHNRYAQFGNIDDLPIDQGILPHLPANFASIGWRCPSVPSTLPNYFSLDRNSLPDLQTLLLTIIDHYDYCTTEDIASDLYYLVTGDGKETSALLTAKVFVCLANDERFRPIHVSEPLHQLRVDDQIYQKTNLQPQKPQPPKQIESPYLNFTIEEMDLSVRTYNCLHRAKIRKVCDLIDKTDEELLKVRNLGRHGVEELREWLEDHKLC